MLAPMTDLRGARFGLAVAVLACALAGCSSAAPAKPTSFTMSGTVVLPIRGSIPSGSSSCTGYQGSSYRNVAEGAAVTVFAADGRKLGGTTLGLGQPHDQGNQSITCSFVVSIPGVPLGGDSFQVQVADQDPVKVSAADAPHFTVNFQ